MLREAMVHEGALVECVRFTKVVPTDEQTDLLYKQLVQRRHVISHRTNPSFCAHQEFVQSNPYRAWYLVSIGETCVGSFYVSQENTLGINIDISDCKEIVSRIIAYLHANYEPLAAVPSVRAATFSINVAPDNLHLLTALEALDKKILQISYSL